MHARLELPLLPQTVDATRAFIQTLDAQIDEAQAFLSLIQGLRRAAAASIGIDREPKGSKIGEILQSANRTHFEGEMGGDDDGA